MMPAKRPVILSPAHTPSGRDLRLEGLALVTVFLAVFMPRAYGLDRLAGVDEANWLVRSANFYTALNQGDFAHTFQREHPGVTTMWAGMAGLLWRFPDYARSSGGQLDLNAYRRVVEQSGHTPLELLVAGEFFMVLANSATLALAWFFARRLLGPVPALIGLLLIAFDPFHAAHTRFLHLDGLLSSLLLLALLAFLSYLNTTKRRDLIVSGIAAGLSWLTKSPGLFLMPAVVLLAAVDTWRHRRLRGFAHPISHLWQFAWPLILWAIVALLIFVALWPTMWVDPIGTVSKVVTQAMGYASQGHESQTFFNGQLYPDGQIDSLAFYPISYVWRSTPVVLVGIVVAALACVFRREPLTHFKTRRVATALVLFVLVFTVLQNMGTKKFDRYLLPVFPALDLLAAIGWVAVASWLRSRRFAPIGHYASSFLLAALILFQAFGTLRTFPYYLSYYNPLMGGNERAPEVMPIGWGEGLDRAASYLNQKPNAPNLRVMSWHSTSFFPFFSGSTWPITSRSSITQDELQQMLKLHYAVLYANQWQRRLPRELLEYLAQKSPERTIWINGLEYARIYKLITVPQAAPPSHPIENASLGGVARLLGYDPPPPLQVTTGTTLPVTLTWEALGTIRQDYAVFIHLAGPDGVPLAQVDRQPLGGTYATTFWEVGQYIADPYQLLIPEDLPPGEYQLLVGMYLPSTGGRLPLLAPDGSVIGDSVSLDSVQVLSP